MNFISVPLVLILYLYFKTNLFDFHVKIKGCHRLRGRKAGTSLYLDVHIEVCKINSL
jgi:divalent metal cation (Fe/Co/Zn/Cd) transporter